jgi:hypothetical protein
VACRIISNVYVGCHVMQSIAGMGPGTGNGARTGHAHEEGAGETVRAAGQGGTSGLQIFPVRFPACPGRPAWTVVRAMSWVPGDERWSNSEIAEVDRLRDGFQIRLRGATKSGCRPGGHVQCAFLNAFLPARMISARVRPQKRWLGGQNAGIHRGIHMVKI